MGAPYIDWHLACSTLDERPGQWITTEQCVYSTQMAYAPEFLKLFDEFIHLANRLAEDGHDGEVSAAILFAAGRYNAFNFLSHSGSDQDKARVKTP